MVRETEWLWGREWVNRKKLEHNHVFAHVPDFDFWTGCREFKDARSDVEP